MGLFLDSPMVNPMIKSNEGLVPNFFMDAIKGDGVIFNF